MTIKEELRPGPVAATDSGQRLDRWLASQLEGQSRARLTALIKAGHVTREDGLCRPCHDDPVVALPALLA